MCHDPRTGVERETTRVRVGVQSMGQGLAQHSSCLASVGYAMLVIGEKGNGTLSQQTTFCLTAICQSDMHLSRSKGLVALAFHA